MMVNGFKTDPSQPGVEKMVITEVNDKWLTENRMRISSADVDFEMGNMLSAQCVFTVKGWGRAICALALMRATFELREMLQACCIFTNQCIKTQFMRNFRQGLKTTFGHCAGHTRLSENAAASVYLR